MQWCLFSLCCSRLGCVPVRIRDDLPCFAAPVSWGCSFTGGVPPPPPHMCCVVPHRRLDQRYTLENAFGLDPASDEFQAVKREFDRVSAAHAYEVSTFLSEEFGM